MRLILTLFYVVESKTLTLAQIENWKRVKQALEAAGKTDCYFYKRAVSIIETGRDLPL